MDDSNFDMENYSSLVDVKSIHVFWLYMRHLPYNCLDARYDNKRNIENKHYIKYNISIYQIHLF